MRIFQKVFTERKIHMKHFFLISDRGVIFDEKILQPPQELAYVPMVKAHIDST